MDKMVLKEARKMASAMKPMFNVGKSGVSDTFVETIDNYLEAHSIVKVKVLSAVDKAGVLEVANEVAQRTDSKIIQKVGFTFVLFRN